VRENGHLGHNGFSSIYLSDAGYTQTAIGPQRAVPVLSEMGAMTTADAWLGRSGAWMLLSPAFASAVLRWDLLAASV